MIFWSPVLIREKVSLSLKDSYNFFYELLYLCNNNAYNRVIRELVVCSLCGI